MANRRQPRIYAPVNERENQGRQTTSDLGPSNLRVAEPEISKPALQKPSIVRVKMSRVPSDNSRTLAQTNIRIIDTQTSRSSHSKNDPSSNNQRQYVYANNVQVLGGDNSIRENVYNTDNPRYPERVDTDQILSNEIRTNSRESGNRRQPSLVDSSYDSYTDNEIGYLTTNTDRDARERQSGLRPENIVDGNHGNSDSEVLGASDERYLWSYGHWTECSTQCGEGVQRRIVSCVDRIKRETTNERLCNENVKPSTSQACNNQNCRSDSPSSYVRWQIGSWGPCSRTCELGDQVQQVYCESVYENGTTTTVNDEKCLLQYRAKPQYRRSCNDIPCISETFTWAFSDWRPCSVTCGEGIESRRIDCRMVGNNGRVTDDKCSPNGKPVDRRRCSMAPCPTDRQRVRTTNSPTYSPRDCRRSRFGCCPDGVTARRSDNDGCRTESSMEQKLVKTGTRTDLDCNRYAGERVSNVEWTKQGLNDPVYRKERFSESINSRYDGRVRLGVNSRLTIYPAYETDSGLYTCTVTLATSGRDRTFSNQIFLDVRDIS
ncbi:A disintegrin and metalloproteinase with thrombospondin motifs 9 [Mactra antiquata]